MADLLLPQSMVQLCVALGASAVTVGGAVVYLRRVRVERPTIGTFNLRDIVNLMVLVVGLPLFYLVLPQWSFIVLLLLTFGSALSIGLRPLMKPGPMWLFIGALLGSEIWVARTMLGTQSGWQLYWVLTDVMVLLAAIAVANLFVQGGMRMLHASWFVMGLAVYDFLFGEVFTVTQVLTDRFVGFPLNPGVGTRFSIYGVEIGLGDLLAFGIYSAATYKAYGVKALRMAIGLILAFGVVAGSLTPLVIHAVTRGSLNVVVPVQTLFGPPAFLLYLYCRRKYGPERTMGQFRATLDEERTAAATASPVAAPVLVDAAEAR
jgi:hypothetical protein